MIKLIVGEKGSGKTKTMIDMINESAEKAAGSIVCIEKGMKSTYNIKSSVRLIDVDDYAVKGYTMFYGFFMGVLAGDYDIEEVYVDGILKLGDHDLEGFSRLLDQIDEVARGELHIVFTVSTDASNLGDCFKKYL
ncbi:MAG: hypothetical protein VB092_04850 [Oscillospiraceae bacterium]|nr:hypothetical protein [Oscillospiraceae bacterium]